MATNELLCATMAADMSALIPFLFGSGKFFLTRKEFKYDQLNF